MTPPRTLAEIVKTVAPPPVVFTTGTVKAVDEATLSVDVTPDDGGEVIANVPLRVMRYQNQTGVAVVPKVGTEVVVEWLDKHRPRVAAAQEWTKIIMLTAQGFGVIISDVIAMGDQNQAKHPVPWGDTLATFLNSFRSWAATHDHGAGPPLTSPPMVPGDLISSDVYTS